MKTHKLYRLTSLFGIVLFLPMKSSGKEIKPSDRTSLVKKSWDEEKREELVEVFGDLSQYQIIWIQPEGLEVHSVRNTGTVEKPAFKTFHWQHGMRKEDVRSKELLPDDLEAIFLAVDSLINISKNEVNSAVDEEESLKHPDRVLLYKRYRNGDVWDWHCISVRSNSQNENMKMLREKLLWRESPTEDEIKSFLQDQK